MLLSRNSSSAESCSICLVFLVLIVIRVIRSFTNTESSIKKTSRVRISYLLSQFPVLMELCWIFSNLSASWICLLGIIAKILSTYLCHVFNMQRENLIKSCKILSTKSIKNGERGFALLVFVGKIYCWNWNNFLQCMYHNYEGQSVSNASYFFSS
jgi:hypothetical protein